MVDFEIEHIQTAKKPLTLTEERAAAITLPQLIELGKKRGYSSGWALRVWQARGN